MSCANLWWRESVLKPKTEFLNITKWYVPLSRIYLFKVLSHKTPTCFSELWCVRNNTVESGLDVHTSAVSPAVPLVREGRSGFSRDTGPAGEPPVSPACIACTCSTLTTLTRNGLRRSGRLRSPSGAGPRKAGGGAPARVGGLGPGAAAPAPDPGPGREWRRPSARRLEGGGVPSFPRLLCSGLRAWMLPTHTGRRSALLGPPPLPWRPLTDAPPPPRRWGSAWAPRGQASGSRAPATGGLPWASVNYAVLFSFLKKRIRAIIAKFALNLM